MQHTRELASGLALSTAIAIAGAAQADAAVIGTQTYTSTGAPHTIQVPANARGMRVELIGGSGGGGFNFDSSRDRSLAHGRADCRMRRESPMSSSMVNLMTIIVRRSGATSVKPC
jgi:hypothetical protein